MEQFKLNKENKDNEYDSLKNNLINKSISFLEVRDILSKLDQSTLSREASDANLLFLNDKEVIGYVSQYPEVEKMYHDFLSFTEFHVAQRLAVTNAMNAISHFKKALESAEINHSDEQWIAYIKGTILYLEGKEIPEDIVRTASENEHILNNFNSGLKERGFPSYEEDYNK